jgi:hypothetical protein
MQDGQIFAKIEINIMDHEDGLGSFVTLANEVRNKFTFTYIRLMGDTHENIGSKKLSIGQEGLLKIIEGFTAGLFNFTYEFRIYNF